MRGGWFCLHAEEGLSAEGLSTEVGDDTVDTVVFVNSSFPLIV